MYFIIHEMCTIFVNHYVKETLDIKRYRNIAGLVFLKRLKGQFSKRNFIHVEIYQKNARWA